MIIRKAMYGCGLYFFIKLAYNSPILCKFAFLTAQNCHLTARRSLLLKILEFCACSDYRACAQIFVVFSGAAVQF